ncbi:hypothetical protein GCM10011399_22170 [Subtercola lobariae]|uniref:DUF4232 domain-containing protein n=1 Tax=Subtercola lobariae TaxID=1588641 RepID=A0A917EWX0_9MICO|nr:hypothetical protein GCM10011399_22170 [Subtercola lobariae]
MLLGIVVVIVVVLLVILKPGSGKAEPAAVPTPSTSAGAPADAANGSGGTPAPSAGADPSTPGAAGATDAAAAAPPTDTPTPTPAATNADGSEACAAGNVTVTAITDSNDYSSGSQPMLSFSIVNTGSQPCTINAGTSQQIYTITSGTEVYWLSTDCQTGASDTLAMLAPGKTVTSTPFAWNRTRSSKTTCDQATPTTVPAGGVSYHLTVSVDGIQSAQSAQFILE